MAESIDTAKLRRIALTRQGIGQRQPFGRGVGATLKAIRHIGYVQIDTISVVVRAHNHVLRTRVPDFQPNHIDRLLKDRQIFEYRFPVAAFRPIQDYRYTLLHAAKFRAKPRTKDKATMRRVIDRIRADGPLRSRDFEDARKKAGGWWNWKPAKAALEQLYFQGDLMISAREGFEKSYDLTERVLPSSIDVGEPSPEEFASFLIDTTLRAHGFATYATFASGARHIPLRGTVKAELKRRTEQGKLREFTNDQGVPFWAEPETLDGKTPRIPKTVQILSPFDNTVIQRERLLEVFNFDYLIECYVPEPKRRFGYFCLPIVYADQLVGRMDCKSHRAEGYFEIKALFLEAGFASRRHVEELAGPLSAAVIEFAKFDGCAEVVVTQTEPAFAKQLLKKAIANRC